MAKRTIANKRLHLLYSGSVQGVGFRFTAERVANSLGLSGWVRNTEDGRVEVVCEGKIDKLEAFLQKINSVFKDYVRGVDVDREDATGEFSGFDIRF